MIQTRTILAPLLSLILAVQIITFSPIPAQAQSGEFTGEMEGKYKYVRGSSYGQHNVDEQVYEVELMFTISDGNFEGTGEGWIEYTETTSFGCYAYGRTDVYFTFSGYLGYMDRLVFNEYEVDPESFQAEYSGCPSGAKDPVTRTVPRFVDMVYDIVLEDGAEYQNGNPDSYADDSDGIRSYNTLIISGSWDAVVDDVDCPVLTITPTLPPASDPTQSTGPTDIASFRLQLDWTGPVPAEVFLEVTEGGVAGVTPSFQFNPVNLHSAQGSVLLDVYTEHAAAGEYPLTIQATVFDFSAKEDCIAIVDTTEVVLVVTEHLSDLPMYCKIDGIVGTVWIFRPGNDDWAAPEEDQVIESGDLIQTTVNGNVGISSDAEQIKLGKRTTIGAAGLSVTSGEISTHYTILKGEEDFTPVDDNQFWQDIATEFVNAHAELGPGLVSAIGCDASLDVDILDCATHEMFYVYKGYVHFAHDEIQEVTEIMPAPGHLWVTPTTVIRALSAEFSMIVDDDGTTTVSVLQGLVWIADAKSKESVFVQSGEQIVVPAEGDGLDEGSLERAVMSLDKDAFQSWWLRSVNKQVQIADYTTATTWEKEYPYKPIDRTSVFSDQDSKVHVWIEFINVLPPKHIVEVKWYQPDGTLYWSDDWEMLAPETYWSSYPLYWQINVKDNKDVTDNLGLWGVDVYFDGELVKKIPFSIVKPALVEDQYVEYEFVEEVSSSEEEIAAMLESGTASAFSESFTGVVGTSIDDPDDIEWVKVTVKDNSPGNTRLQTELKLAGQQRSLVGEPQDDFAIPLFIPTKGIETGYVLPTTGESGEMPPMVLDGIVSWIIGDKTVQAFEFSGTTEGYEGTAHYEKETGILVSFLVDGRFEDETGFLEINLGLRATDIGIPTSVSLSTIPIEISQYSQLEVSGKLDPPLGTGQVVLVYHKHEDNEMIKKTVAVVDGAFSDNHMIEKDGTYAVSAEYPGAGAYLSSASSPQALTVTPSGCLIATAAYGSEFAPQVQMLRHIRDGQLMKTSSGSSFMSAFNSVYYSFSPTVANWERENPAFRDSVRTAITPLIMTLSILPHVSMDSEAEALGYGLGVIMLNIGIYFAAPALAIMALRSKFKHDK